MNGEQAFDWYVGKTATVQEIAQMSESDIRRQVVELVTEWDTDDDPDEVATAIIEYVQPERARARVQNTPELQPYADIIEYDWNDTGHYHWVATAPVAEILKWAEGIRADEQEAE